jgi:hypothetical protein
MRKYVWAIIRCNVHCLMALLRLDYSHRFVSLHENYLTSRGRLRNRTVAIECTCRKSFWHRPANR